jgi:hypothetical protein
LYWNHWPRSHRTRFIQRSNEQFENYAVRYRQGQRCARQASQFHETNTDKNFFLIFSAFCPC